MIVNYIYKNEGKGWSVLCEVRGTFVPPTPATYDSMEDGGYVEDVEFTIEEFRLKIGERYFEVKLTPGGRIELELLIENEYNSDKDMQDEILALFAEN